ncbi:MAG: translocation/assembly module TamB domain-containing protein, partial [Planctomycetota bacterium]
KVQIADAGKPSSVDISMDVDDASTISAKGTATPSKKGWTLEGGDFNVQISKLQLASLKPLFVLAGQDVDMSGEVNADARVQIEQNQIKQLLADAVISDFIQGTGDQRVAFEKPITVSVQAGQQGDTIKIDTLKVESGFCNVVCSGTLEAMNYSIDADLAQTQRIIEPFMDMGEVSIAGALSARGRAEMTDGQVRLVSENSKIEKLQISVPDSEPFVQDQVMLDADILMDMGEKTIDIRSLNLQGSQGETLINITKGAVKKKVGNAQTQLSGHLEAEYDWQVLSAFASAYLPEGLSVEGKRKDAFSFTSDYPTDTPEAMTANLSADAAVGFDSAEYQGLDFGPTELNMTIRKGVLDFSIPEMTVNEGAFRFAGTVDLNEASKILRLKEPMQVMDAIHINEQMTNTMLKYLNPLFANQSDVSGFASLTCDALEIPFDMDEEEKIVVDGVIQMDTVRLKATGAVGDILAQTNNKSELDARLLPSRILLRDGVMRYDEMEFHLDAYPTGFAGKIYLDKRLDMQVFVPYKFDVERLRFPTVKIGEDLSDRLPLPVDGTVDDPQVRLDKLFDSILKKHSPELIQKGIEELLKNL